VILTWLELIVMQFCVVMYIDCTVSHSQTSKNRLTAPPSVAAPPAILSSRDCSIAGYS